MDNRVINLIRLRISQTKDWDIQFKRFVEHIEYIISIPLSECKYLSFEEMYSTFFKIVYFCDSNNLKKFKKECLNYLKNRCVCLFYPKLHILAELMIYYRRNDHELNVWFDSTISKAKKRSKTLMELTLDIVDKHPDLKKQLDSNIKNQIVYRIKNYYFV